MNGALLLSPAISTRIYGYGDAEHYQLHFNYFPQYKLSRPLIRRSVTYIANFEPNEIATKSEEKTKNQRRKHRAGEGAQKIEVQTRKHRAGEVACHGGQAQKVEIAPTNSPSRRAVTRSRCR